MKHWFLWTGWATDLKPQQKLLFFKLLIFTNISSTLHVNNNKARNKACSSYVMPMSMKAFTVSVPWHDCGVLQPSVWPVTHPRRRCWSTNRAPAVPSVWCRPPVTWTDTHTRYAVMCGYHRDSISKHKKNINCCIKIHSFILKHSVISKHSVIFKHSVILKQCYIKT